ncbi:MAG TPA: thiamine-binding protein [Exilispira sp.]|nr:thiamine-binding protein [Exilispira sp.]
MEFKTSAAIQVIPIGISDKNQIYEFVDHAINLIKDSGLKYLVTPFETVIEGDISKILSLIEKINNSLLTEGLQTICINVKIWSGNIGTIEEKLEKYKN